MQIALYRLRVRGDPRGPGGPPHQAALCHHVVWHGVDSLWTRLLGAPPSCVATRRATSPASCASSPDSALRSPITSRLTWPKSPRHAANVWCSRSSKPSPPSCPRSPSPSAPASSSSTASNGDRKSTRLNSSHLGISYAVFCLK